MTLAIAEGRAVRVEHCGACEQDYACVTGFVVDADDRSPVAVYYAALHGHDDAHEAWLDVTLAESPDPSLGRPRVTFGARVGDFGSHGGLGAMLTDGGIEHEQTAAFGRRLTADEALADRRLEEFWAVVDLLLVADPDVHAHTHA